MTQVDMDQVSHEQEISLLDLVNTHPVGSRVR